MTIINHTWKFIFIHIPKCGGTSVAYALEPLCSWRDLQLGGTPFGEQLHAAFSKQYMIAKHSFASEVRRFIGISDWERYSKFALVRHPVARTISTFRYLKHHQKHYPAMRSINSISEFLEWEKWNEAGPDRMFQPQSKWLVGERKGEDLIIDHFCKLEDADADFHQILKFLGIPQIKVDRCQFQKFNSVPVSEEIQISKSERAKIEERYSKDFDLFGY